MITRIVLHNLFTVEQVYVLGIPKPLAPPPDTRCRGLSRWSPSNQIKETSMIKTEYKKGGRPTKGAGVTMSEFIRKLLDRGNVIERLTVEQADFIRKLCGMANNLNQLAHRANAEGFHVIAPFHKTIIGKIDEILNLIRR